MKSHATRFALLFAALLPCATLATTIIDENFDTVPTGFYTTDFASIGTYLKYRAATNATATNCPVVVDLGSGDRVVDFHHTGSQYINGTPVLYRDLLNDSISTTETGHNFLTLRVTVTRQNLGKLVQIFIHNLNQQSAASGNSQIFLRLDPDGTVKYVHRPTPEAAVTTTSAGVKVTTGVPYVFTVWADLRATGSTNRDTWGFSYALASAPETPVWTSADLWTCVDAGAQPRTLAIVGGSDGNFSAEAYFTVHDVRFESRPFQLPTVILLR